MRLVESGRRAAVDFLAAADRTTHARQGLDTANISLDQSKSRSDQQVYQHLLVKVEEAREQVFTAAADAENAYAALRLLVPSVADQARGYRDYCLSATAPSGRERSPSSSTPAERCMQRWRYRNRASATAQGYLPR